MAKVMNHRFEKLSMLLDANESHSNDVSQISIVRENTINETIDASYSCSSPIKVEPLLISQYSNRFKAKTIFKENTSETSNPKSSNSTQLNIPRRTHMKQRRFTCYECQKTFSNKCSLAIHKRSHNGEKLYSCDLCKKTFAHSSSLVDHKRIHTGEKPFHCDICQKKFAQSSHLTIHKKIHTGEKPYHCDLCPIRTII